MSDLLSTLVPEIAGLAKLREPFAPEHLGKLPKLTCKACSDRQCSEHKKQKCPACHAWISTAHVDLDFVGHAPVTDRLLTVDPLWSWEPCGWTTEGTPAITTSASGKELLLWGRLTVLGVTRLGVGSVTKGAFDAEKQLIGDFIRNAAMRFGVALDLWSKTELESAETEPAAPTRAQHSRSAAKAPETPLSAPSAPPGRPALSHVEGPPAADDKPKPSPYAAFIHSEATRLGITDDVLDSILLNVTGSTTANAVNRENRQAVLDAMARETA